VAPLAPLIDLSKRTREGSKTNPSFFISNPLRIGVLLWDRHQTERVFRRTTSRSARMSSSGSSMSNCSLTVPPPLIAVDIPGQSLAVVVDLHERSLTAFAITEIIHIAYRPPEFSLGLRKTSGRVLIHRPGEFPIR
jgi:hypothetical protein